jgi:hypothetical protein
VDRINSNHHIGCTTDSFGGLTITLEDKGETLLNGPVVDQATLHGVLKKVRDVVMPLLSVIRVTLGQAETKARQ